MFPKLKISNLTNLQDARYSAAVGFDYISFSLERGNTRKLAPNLIWNIVNWLEGPEIILELNAASLEELTGIGESVPYSAITIPLTDWNERVFQYCPHVVIRADHQMKAEAMASMILQAESNGYRLQFELSLPHPEEVNRYGEVLEHVFVHLPSLDLGLQLLDSPHAKPYGISFGEEAEESPGMLDYEQIDALLEVSD